MKKEMEMFFLEMTDDEQQKVIELMKVKYDQNKLSRSVPVGEGKEERKQVLGFSSRAEGEPCPLLQNRCIECRIPDLVSDRGSLDILQRIPKKIS